MGWPCSKDTPKTNIWSSDITKSLIELPNLILYVLRRQSHPSFSLGYGVDHYKVGMGTYHAACVTIEHPKGVTIS
jgi:hypothetical protein